MLIFFNWNIRIRNTFFLFLFLWFYFFDSSWIQISSWIIFFGICVITADLDEDKIGDTFEEFFDEVMGNYNEITNKDFNLAEDTWIVQEQLKNHLHSHPRDIDELLDYRELHTKKTIIKEHRKNHSYEEQMKHIKFSKWYTERDDIEYYTSEGLEVKSWVLQVVSDWWYADEHLVIPDQGSNDYRLIELLAARQNEKVYCDEARDQIIKEQVDKYLVHNQKKIKPYKKLLWSWRERTVRSEPVFWPRSNKRQPKSQRSWARAVKRAKNQRHRLLKHKIASTSIEFPSNEQLQNYILLRFGNSLCFQPDLAVGIIGKKLRSAIYSKSEIPSAKMNWRLIKRQIKNQLEKNERDWNYDPEIMRAGLLAGDDSLPRPKPKGWNATLKARAKLKVSPQPKK